jgi:hypothetical protein
VALGQLEDSHSRVVLDFLTVPKPTAAVEKARATLHAPYRAAPETTPTWCWLMRSVVHKPNPQRKQRAPEHGCLFVWDSDYAAAADAARSWSATA